MVHDLSFSSLLEVHDKLDSIFLAHQELLLASEPELALRLLASYRALLQLHMQHEEELLLPIFSRPPENPRWPRVLYPGQHAKMLRLLDDCQTALTLAIESGAFSRRFVIALLERETTYKHLAEHHDGAERQGFFPELDKKADPSERLELVVRCRDEWGMAMTDQREVLEAAKARLQAMP